MYDMEATATTQIVNPETLNIGQLIVGSVTENGVTALGPYEVLAVYPHAGSNGTTIICIKPINSPLVALNPRFGDGRFNLHWKGQAIIQAS